MKPKILLVKGHDGTLIGGSECCEGRDVEDYYAGNQTYLAL